MVIKYEFILVQKLTHSFFIINIFHEHFFGGRGEDFCYRVRALARHRERQRDRKREITSRGDGHTAIPSPPFSSWDLGHARTRARHEFKPLGLGLEQQSTTWEFSDIVIMLTADPSISS